MKAIRSIEDLNLALKELLSDDFYIYGDDASLFAKAQKAISDNTNAVEQLLPEIEILSVLPEDENTEDKMHFYPVKPGGITDLIRLLSSQRKGILQEKSPEKQIDKVQKLLDTTLMNFEPRFIDPKTLNPIKDLDDAIDYDAVIRELKDTRLMFRVMKPNEKSKDIGKASKIYIVSKYAIATLCQRLKLNGDAMHEPSLERDLHMARRFADCKSPVQFMVKKQAGIEKIFMVASSSYRFLPMDVIESLYTEFSKNGGMGTMKCEGWEINHSISRIRFTFPDKKTGTEIAIIYGRDDDEVLIPGIEIISSDIGDCAFTVRGFWKIKNSILYMDEVSKKHSGSITIDELKRETQRNIFDRYTILPKRIFTLLEMEITPSVFFEAAEDLRVAQNDAFKLQREINQVTRELENAKMNKRYHNKTSLNLKQTLSTLKTEYVEIMEEVKIYEKKYNNMVKDNITLMNALFKQIIKDIGCRPLTERKDWLEKVMQNFNGMESITAYDVMNMILETQTIPKHPESVERCRKAMKELPYLDFKKYAEDIIEKNGLFILPPDKDETEAESEEINDSESVQSEESTESAGDLNAEAPVLSDSEEAEANSEDQQNAVTVENPTESVAQNFVNAPEQAGVDSLETVPTENVVTEVTDNGESSVLEPVEETGNAGVKKTKSAGSKKTGTKTKTVKKSSPATSKAKAETVKKSSAKSKAVKEAKDSEADSVTKESAKTKVTKTASKSKTAKAKTSTAAKAKAATGAKAKTSAATKAKTATGTKAKTATRSKSKKDAGLMGNEAETKSE